MVISALSQFLHRDGFSLVAFSFGQGSLLNKTMLLQPLVLRYTLWMKSTALRGKLNSLTHLLTEHILLFETKIILLKPHCWPLTGHLFNNLYKSKSCFWKQSHQFLVQGRRVGLTTFCLRFLATISNTSKRRIFLLILRSVQSRHPLKDNLSI